MATGTGEKPKKKMSPVVVEVRRRRLARKERQIKEAYQRKMRAIEEELVFLRHNCPHTETRKCVERGFDRECNSCGKRLAIEPVIVRRDS